MSTLHKLFQLAAAALSLVPSLALATDLTEAQRHALDAFAEEFVRNEVTAPEQELAARFKQSCDAGYPLACDRSAWWSSGRADLGAAGKVAEKACENGDRVACMVVAWSLEAEAPGNPEPDRVWRSAARILKQHCDQGFQPACHEFGFYLQENRGFQADPRAAMLRWQPACDKGWLPSCTTIGRLQLSGGPGVSKDPSAGLAKLDVACKKGSPAACFTWGELTNQGWPPDQYQSFYQKLCQDGHRESCWTLGLAYANASVQAPTPESADALLQRGCELGHPQSCYEAARIATAAQQPDWANVGALYSSACHHGDSDGCEELVKLFLAGKVEGSLRSDATAFELACEKENLAMACSQLAIGLLAGVDLPRDPERARRLLGRSCVDANSSADACSQLGQVFEEGLGGDRDRTEASKFYRWACYGDRFDACERRGDLLISGIGIPRDDLEALAMYDRACTGGVPKACSKAGGILDEATYVPRDVPRAASLFQTACDAGVGKACASLGRLNEQGVNAAPDFQAARDAYDKGVALMDIESHRRLSRLLWLGLGGGKDKGRARELAADACQNGDPVACRGPAFL